MTDTASSAAQASLPLFYSNPVPVHAERHKDWKVKQVRSFAYAAKTHAVPVVLDEVPALQAAYPLVFSVGENPGLVALVGLRADENLFVGEDGTWRQGFPIPSYVQRYPFILIEVPDEKRMILAMEEDAGTVGTDGELALYEDGKATPQGQEILNYCMAFNNSAQATQAFCTELQQRGLLIEQRADIVTPGNRRLSLSGFRVIDEQKFNALPDEVFLEWRKRNWVGMVYAHLLSLGRWQTLIDMMKDREVPAAAE